MKRLADFADAELRIFDRPPPGPDVRDVYLIGICGTGMGALAGLLKQAGFSVRGSDLGVYPPMSTHLAALGIPVQEGFDVHNLEPAPDLVIVGNACTPTHVEAAEARVRRLPQLSLPEALAHFFLEDRRRVVVAGTHGKTTTTGLLVHILQEAGHDPGYFVGGIMQKLSRSYDIGTGRHFVVEGDEYDSAYFDKQPKFMHYDPQVAIVTSMEFDHADIYESWDDYEEAFLRFTAQVPPHGLLVVCSDQVNPTSLTGSAPVLTYGIASGADVTAQSIMPEPAGIKFNLIYKGTDLGWMHLPMSGRHNLCNALAAAAVALHEGLSAQEVARGLTSFTGMKRRQEILGEPGGVLVVDDFAHHPTAVRATIEAARECWPGRRLIAVFEPRSNSSRRKVFEMAYGNAFEGASCAYLSAPPFRHNDDARRFMDVRSVIQLIAKGGSQAAAFSELDELLDTVSREATPDDLILIMSNGGFGGLHEKLMSTLEAKFAD